MQLISTKKHKRKREKVHFGVVLSTLSIFLCEFQEIKLIHQCKLDWSSAKGKQIVSSLHVDNVKSSNQCELLANFAIHFSPSLGSAKKEREKFSWKRKKSSRRRKIMNERKFWAWMEIGWVNYVQNIICVMRQRHDWSFHRLNASQHSSAIFLAFLWISFFIFLFFFDSLGSAHTSSSIAFNSGIFLVVVSRWNGSLPLSTETLHCRGCTWVTLAFRVNLPLIVPMCSDPFVRRIYVSVIVNRHFDRKLSIQLKPLRLRERVELRWDSVSGPFWQSDDRNWPKISLELVDIYTENAKNIYKKIGPITDAPYEIRNSHTNFVSI